VVAFMPWNGYNFEDSISSQRRGRRRPLHLYSHRGIVSGGTRHQLGPEEITRDISNLSERMLGAWTSRVSSTSVRKWKRAMCWWQGNAQGENSAHAGRKAAGAIFARRLRM